MGGEEFINVLHRYTHAYIGDLPMLHTYTLPDHACCINQHLTTNPIGWRDLDPGGETIDTYTTPITIPVPGLVVPTVELHYKHVIERPTPILIANICL